MRKSTSVALILGLLVATVAALSTTALADGLRGRSPNVVDIVATGHALEAPAEIPSGWTTFRLHNRSSETHFALLDLMPENKSVADSIEEVVPAFQTLMNAINGAEETPLPLPEWSGEIVYMGGPGLIAPGETAETTVLLEPGTYVLECYVKTRGVFHSTHGMITGLTVTDEVSGADEPRADVEVTVSSAGGFVVDGAFRPGNRTIAVHFEDQIVHGNFLGHDVHLARIDEDTDLEVLAAWMDWSQPTGLEEPAPVTFLGGVHDMPAGSTGYFTARLTPGDYVLVAEVDDPQGKDMLHTFSIP